MKKTINAIAIKTGFRSEISNSQIINSKVLTVFFTLVSGGVFLKYILFEVLNFLQNFSATTFCNLCIPVLQIVDQNQSMFCRLTNDKI